MLRYWYASMVRCWDIIYNDTGWITEQLRIIRFQNLRLFHYGQDFLWSASFELLATSKKSCYAHESRHRFFDAVFATTWIGTPAAELRGEKSWKKEERRTKRCIFNAAADAVFFFFSCFAEELTKSDTLLHFHGAHILLTFISVYIRYLLDGFFFKRYNQIFL